MARSAEKLWKRPVVLATAIAAPSHEDVVLFDAAAQVIARIPRKVSDDALVAYRGGVLVRVHDEDTGQTEVSYWELGDEGAGRVAKLRIHFLGGEPEVDRSVAKSTAAPKPYSASAKFALGDTLEHVKFGTGSVIRVGTDSKIDVQFADATRTLVHAKK